MSVRLHMCFNNCRLFIYVYVCLLNLSMSLYCSDDFVFAYVCWFVCLSEDTCFDVRMSALFIFSMSVVLS